MIVFDKLWKTMEAKGISQYKLIKEHQFSTGQLDRLRKNGNVNTYTLANCVKFLTANWKILQNIQKINGSRYEDLLPLFV